VHISLLDESVHVAQCVVTAQMQKDTLVVIYVSITMSANHTLAYSDIVPNVCIHVSQRDRGFVSFDLS